VGEKRPPTTILRKDVTDRLKVLNSLLNLRASLDKAESAEGDSKEQPILKLFAERGMDVRIGVLVNQSGEQPLPAPRQLVEGADNAEYAGGEASPVRD
jgi:hypothetical protein